MQSYRLAFRLSGKNRHLGPKKLSKRVMQNIYSPIKFYLTFPHDNSWTLDKILNMTK